MPVANTGNPDDEVVREHALARGPFPLTWRGKQQTCMLLEIQG
jgi:hypothetical protein